MAVCRMSEAIHWTNETRRLDELQPWVACVDCGKPKVTKKQQKAPRCHVCENKNRFTNIVYHACPICGKPKQRGRSDRVLCKTCAAKARWRSEEHRKKIHDAAIQRFGHIPSWGYVNFTDEVKELVRDRDGRTCFVCGTPESGNKLDVHHVDYDKTNSAPENLVSLCKSCHMRTCNNRDYWKGFFSAALS